MDWWTLLTNRQWWSVHNPCHTNGARNMHWEQLIQQTVQRLKSINLSTPELSIPNSAADTTQLYCAKGTNNARELSVASLFEQLRVLNDVNVNESSTSLVVYVPVFFRASFILTDIRRQWRAVWFMLIIMMLRSQDLISFAETLLRLI